MGGARRVRGVGGALVANVPLRIAKDWADRAAAIEREACAEVAEVCKVGASENAYRVACYDIAALIRARGQE